MPHELTDLALGVLFGFLFLSVFYQAVKTDWPESYFGAGDVSAYEISMTPLRYALFRFVPVYVTCVFVAVALDRRESFGAVGAVILGVGHGSVTLGTALVVWARSDARQRPSRTSIALIRAVVFAGVIVVALAAAVTRDVLAAFVPPIPDLVAAFWTAIFAGITGAFLVRISRGALGEYGLVTRSLSELPPRLLDLASQIAKETAADDILVQAVMVVENVQRPKWFRTIERLKSRVVRRGTYGIMQVASDHPLSDEESIRKAVTERMAGVSVKAPTGSLDPKALRVFAANYNSNPNFATLLLSAYALVQQSRTSTP